MYERFYGLRERPFNLTPDPEFLFLTQSHKEALEKTIYGITRREGFAVILGDVGTGKTTLCWALLGRLEKDVRTALVLNPMLSDEDLLRVILQDFGVRGQKPRADEQADTAPQASPAAAWTQGLSKKELLDELSRFLLACAEEDVFCVAIIDEAQNLSVGTLEQLRMLSNLETAKTKLLQIIFVGQLEFMGKLKSERLKSLNQRISNRYCIKPLSRKEVREYIYHRLRIAQAPDELGFSRPALRKIRRFSRGYPRLINLLCDRALLAGYSEKAFWITGRMIRKAARGLRDSEEFHAPKPPFARLLVPVAVVLVMAIVAAFFLWMLRWGNPLSLRISREPASTQAMTREEPSGTAAGDAAPVDAGTQVPTTSTPIAPAQQPVATETKTESRAPAAPPPAAVPASSPRYLLQVYALSSREYAGKAVSELRGEGYEAFVKPEGKWFVVLVGPFGELGQAQEVVGAIARRFSVSPIIRASSDSAIR